MTTYVACRTREGFREESDLLLANLRAKTKESQVKLLAKVSDSLIESLMDAFVFDMIDAVEMKPFTEKIIRQLGTLVVRTSKVLIDKVVIKLPNDELLTLIEYFDQRRMLIDEEMFLVFPLPDKFAESLQFCFSEIDEGNGEKVKDEFAESLEEANRLGLLYYMKEPMKVIKLGMIMRRIADAAYATTKKAIEVAMKKIIQRMDDKEMRDFSSYFRIMLLEAD